ncbi:NADPH-dependent F420 reductase [Streptomyces sp. NPDC051018]|uniref:NADPH-dependent F420 reductase n=1 Tax=Streptomyces sp. NPDC051018 TaxID=3365639 RepID=UPI003787E1C2
MTNIGVLGTGNAGRALGTHLAEAGHAVVFGSRDPDARRDLGLPALTVADAIAHGDIVVNATPGTASLALLRPFASRFTGKVLLDIAVGFTDTLELAHPNSSIGEQLQEALPGASVVKTFCTVDSIVMVTPEVLTGPGHVFLSGEDEDAKARVAALLRDLGWSDSALFDLGGIATARGQEHMALFLIAVAESLGSYTFGLRVVPSEARPKARQ